MAKALKRIGFHNVQLAHNPREALKAADEFNFDIVFSDYNMGDGKNGQQLLQELRHFKKVRYDCIFIMISAETSREVVLGAIESEPEGYIAKPFNEAMLHRKIDRLMDKQAQAAYTANNIEQKGLLIGKAISIIAGLQSSLDPAQSEEVSGNLDKLYDYMQRRLLEANLHNDMTMVAEVADLLETVKSGWDAIEPGH